MTKTLRFWLNSRWRHVKLFPLTFKTEKPINPKKLERNTTKRASPSAHRSTEVFATQKRAAHIDGHDLAPGFDRKVGERHARWKNCCVVHQHFAATPRALDFFSSCNDRRLVTNVAPNRQKRGRAFSRSTTFRSSSTTLAPMLASIRTWRRQVHRRRPLRRQRARPSYSVKNLTTRFRSRLFPAFAV